MSRFAPLFELVLPSPGGLGTASTYPYTVVLAVLVWKLAEAASCQCFGLCTAFPDFSDPTQRICDRMIIGSIQCCKQQHRFTGRKILLSAVVNTVGKFGFMVSFVTTPYVT